MPSVVYPCVFLVNGGYSVVCIFVYLKIPKSSYKGLWGSGGSSLPVRRNNCCKLINKYTHFLFVNLTCTIDFRISLNVFPIVYVLFLTDQLININVLVFRRNNVTPLFVTDCEHI